MKKIIITYWGFKARTLQATQQHAMRMCDRWTDGHTIYMYNYYQWNSFKICLQLTYECNRVHSCFDIENFSIYLLHSHWWKRGNQATIPCFHRSDMNEYFKETTAQIICVCMYIQNGRKTDRWTDRFVCMCVICTCDYLNVLLLWLWMGWIGWGLLQVHTTIWFINIIQSNSRQHLK